MGCFELRFKAEIPRISLTKHYRIDPYDTWTDSYGGLWNIYPKVSVTSSILYYIKSNSENEIEYEQYRNLLIDEDEQSSLVTTNIYYGSSFDNRIKDHLMPIHAEETYIEIEQRYEKFISDYKKDYEEAKNSYKEKLNESYDLTRKAFFEIINNKLGHLRTYMMVKDSTEKTFILNNCLDTLTESRENIMHILKRRLPLIYNDIVVRDLHRS